MIGEASNTGMMVYLPEPEHMKVTQVHFKNVEQ